MHSFMWICVLQSSLNLLLLMAEASVYMLLFCHMLMLEQSTVRSAKQCKLQEVFSAATQSPCRSGASGIAARFVRLVCKLCKSVNTDRHGHQCPNPHAAMANITSRPKSCCICSMLRHHHVGWVRRGGEAGPSGRSGVTPRRTGAWVSGSNSKHACSLML